MRFRRALFVLPIVVLLLAVASAPARAQQPPPTADQVSAAVQRFYESIGTLRTHFQLTQFQRVSGHYVRGAGELLIKRPGKMRFNFDADPTSPNHGNVLVSDGARIQQFAPGDDGEPGQVVETSMADSDLTGPLSFLLGTGRLDAQFTFRLVPPPADFHAGGTLRPYVLELTPKTPTPHYEKVLLFVSYDSVHSVAGVSRIVIINHVGDRTKYEFSAPVWNARANVRDEDFRFTAPVGTQRITPGNMR